LVDSNCVEPCVLHAGSKEDVMKKMVRKSAEKRLVVELETVKRLSHAGLGDVQGGRGTQTVQTSSTWTNQFSEIRTVE
jgi:hypothetical protein